MTYSFSRTPAPRGSSLPLWSVCRDGVIGTAGRTRIASFASKAVATKITNSLNAGEITEDRAIEMGRVAADARRDAAAGVKPEGQDKTKGDVPSP